MFRYSGRVVAVSRVCDALSATAEYLVAAPESNPAGSGGGEPHPIAQICLTNASTFAIFESEALWAERFALPFLMSCCR